MLPYQITNGQVADASPVMANFSALVGCLSAAAPAGSTNALQLNAGSGAFAAVGPLGNGQLVIGATAGAPQAAALTPGPGISIANGPGSITISTVSGAGTAANRNITVNAPTSSQFADATVYGFGSSSTPLTYVNDPVNGLILSDTTSDTSGFKSYLRAIPGSPLTFSFAARLRASGVTSNAGYGLIFADASGNAMIFGTLSQNGSPWSYQTPSWSGGSWNVGSWGKYINQADWFKIAFDASGNVLYYASTDGTNWKLAYTISLASRGVGNIVRYGFTIWEYQGGGSPLLQIPWFYSDEFPAPSAAPIL
ncbi:hypothetical protein MSC49_43100 (plasmid) [Methylosinus sp. C49]|nr:hypothetical protein MSC49_43100 [Methylosinus sp. C49]